MTSVIRSANISDSTFVLSNEEDGVVDNDAMSEEQLIQDGMTDSDVGESVIVCDEKEKKILEYASALEESQKKIVELEGKNNSLVNKIEGLKENACEEGRKDGFEKGYKEGSTEAKSELVEQIKSIDLVTNSYKDEMEKLLGIAEDTLVETVLVAVGKIIGDKIKDPNGWGDIVLQTVRNMDHTSRLQIRVSPEDYDYLCNASELNTEIGSNIETKIVADEHVSIGGCILEHDGGTLDARLEIQLQRLKEALISVREQRKSDLDAR